MVPLSRELACLILPHENFDSHLNKSAKGINKDLELKNFKHTGETLVEVLKEMVVDWCPVNAEYIQPTCIAKKPNNYECYNDHVKESQYFLQIVKCVDKDCCRDWRSNIKDILPLSNGFLTPHFFTFVLGSLLIWILLLQRKIVSPTIFTSLKCTIRLKKELAKVAPTLQQKSPRRHIWKEFMIIRLYP